MSTRRIAMAQEPCRGFSDVWNLAGARPGRSLCSPLPCRCSLPPLTGIGGRRSRIIRSPRRGWATCTPRVEACRAMTARPWRGICARRRRPTLEDNSGWGGCTPPGGECPRVKRRHYGGSIKVIWPQSLTSPARDSRRGIEARSGSRPDFQRCSPPSRRSAAIAGYGSHR